MTSLATKGDVIQAKDDLRREMKLWLGLGIAGGNVVAAFAVAWTKSPSLPANVGGAIYDALSFLFLG